METVIRMAESREQRNGDCDKDGIESREQRNGDCDKDGIE